LTWKKFGFKNLPVDLFDISNPGVVLGGGFVGLPHSPKPTCQDLLDLETKRWARGRG
jgi:hypothetical protein